MEFLNYLQDYEKENIDNVKKIVNENKQKTDTIIQEAFYSDFCSKKEAKLRISSDLINESDKIDVQFLKDNMNEILTKVENLDEGAIKIIINNNEGNKEKAKLPPLPPILPPLPKIDIIPSEEDGNEPDIEFEDENAKVGEGCDKDDKKEELNEEEVEVDGLMYNAKKFKTDKEANEYIKTNKEYGVIKSGDDYVFVAKNSDKGKKVEEKVEESVKTVGEKFKESINMIEVDDDYEDEGDLGDVEGDEDGEDADITWSDIEAHLVNIDDKLDQLIDKKEDEDEGELGDELEDELGDEIKNLDTEDVDNVINDDLDEDTPIKKKDLEESHGILKNGENYLQFLMEH